MIYAGIGALILWLATVGWGFWHGNSEYDRGKKDADNAWVAEGARLKAEEEARNKGAAEQSAKDADAVAARVGPLAAAIRAGRVEAAKPLKVVDVFPPGCKVAGEVVQDANR